MLHKKSLKRLNNEKTKGTRTRRKDLSLFVYHNTTVAFKKKTLIYIKEI